MTQLRHRFLAAPRTVFPQRAAPGQPERFWRGALRSPALPAAANNLAVRDGVSTSMLFLAAQALLLGQLSRSERCAIEVVLANRQEPRLRWTVANLAQTSLVVVDLVDTDFRSLVRRTWSAWVVANRSGCYDYAEMRALRTRLERERGVAFDFEVFFNDFRVATRPDPSRLVPAARIRELAGEGEFRWVDRLVADRNKFFLRVQGTPDEIDISTLADTAFVPPDRICAVLEGIQRLLVWQATADPTEAGQRLTAELVGDITGVGDVGRGPDWVRVDGVWVELPAVDELVRSVTADVCQDSTVVAESAGDGAVRLTAYLAAADPQAPPTCEELHRRCALGLASIEDGTNWTHALPQWQSAVTPHHYVVTDRRPVDPSPAAWRAERVLAAGSGRDPAGPGRDRPAD